MCETERGVFAGLRVVVGGAVSRIDSVSVCVRERGVYALQNVREIKVLATCKTSIEVDFNSRLPRTLCSFPWVGVPPSVCLFVPVTLSSESVELTS